MQVLIYLFSKFQGHISPLHLTEFFNFRMFLFYIENTQILANFISRERVTIACKWERVKMKVFFAWYYNVLFLKMNDYYFFIAQKKSFSFYNWKNSIKKMQTNQKRPYIDPKIYLKIQTWNLQGRQWNAYQI